ncbi:MAG: hypothetical protein AB7F96_15500 [Beijerinckiaceae bacterium]
MTTFLLHEKRDAIIDAACKKYNVSRQQVRGRTKPAAVVYCRWEIAAGLCEIGFSKAGAGRAINKDHTTIIHGLERWADPEVRAEAERLAAKIAAKKAAKQPKPVVRRVPDIEAILVRHPLKPLERPTPIGGLLYWRAMRGRRALALRDEGLSYSQIAPHIFMKSLNQVGKIISRARADLREQERTRPALDVSRETLDAA